MSRFTYQARDRVGQLVVGVLEAPDERTVASTLSRQGYQPVKIRRQTTAQQWNPLFFLKQNRVDRQEVLILFRELAALLRAGIPLATSLDGAIQQTQPDSALRKMLGHVTRDVQGGSSLSEAMNKYPDVFPELFVSMIRVGEVAGILDQVLEQLAQLGTQELETRSKIQAAFLYPMVLVGFALVVVTVLLVGVLPQFVSVFEASKVSLPLPTKVLLGLSGTVRRFWWLLLVSGAAGLWWLRRFHASPKGRWVMDRWTLSLPLIGVLYRKLLIARIARILGAMLKTGVPLLEALTVVEKTVPNVVFQQTIQRTRSAVAEGQSLAEPWTASGLFPPLVLQLVSVGERTGQLDMMLSEITSFYDPEIELTIRNLTTLLEPALLMIMGLLVGFIALSVLLPIFQLIHVFKR